MTDGKKSGVWFLEFVRTALYCAAWFARNFFKLPYHHATITTADANGICHYSAQRGSREFIADYKPGQFAPSEPGSFSHWATERYCLYCADRDGRLYRGEVQHAKWPLQEAAVEIRINTIAGIQLGRDASDGFILQKIDVVLWSLDRRLIPTSGAFNFFVTASLSVAQTTSQPLSLST